MRIKYTLAISFVLFTFFSISQVWEQETDYPGDARHHPVTFSLDGNGYLVTGSTDNNDYTKDFYKYDPINDSWTTLTDFPGEARSYSISATWNGKAYMGFGAGNVSGALDDLWEYDPNTDTWTELATCPCAGRYHPTFVIADGLIFVGMGNNTGGNLNDWWEYNIATDNWVQRTNLPGPSRHHPYMFAVNGDVYTGLGHGNGSAVYNDWYKWDLSTESWTQLNDFPAEGRVAGTQFNIGNRGFVLSGDGDDHSYMSTGEFWEYNYQNDTWAELPSHPGLSRWAPGSFTIGNMVYFTSGEVRAWTNAGLKNDLWSFNLESIVSIEENDQKNLSIFPNPTVGQIYIQGIEENTSKNVIITGINGKMVMETTTFNNVIDVEMLSPGIYFLQLQGNNELSPIKFVKN